MKNTLKLVVGCALALNLISCGGGGGSGSSTSSTSSCSSGTAGTGSASITTLGIVDNVVGSGAAAADNDTLTVNYTGWLYDSSDANDLGTEFSPPSTSTFSFVLGVGDVIQGWDLGLVGMQVGGTRTLTIPSSMGYGTCPVADSPIPPNSALVFQVELVGLTT